MILCMGWGATRFTCRCFRLPLRCSWPPALPVILFSQGSNLTHGPKTVSDCTTAFLPNPVRTARLA